MKYGGHQTFTIREGWLYKGLSLLIDPEKRHQLIDPYAMDYLGVGRNMAKAIKHWLIAAKLADKSFEPTEFAAHIHKYDPYFIDIGTWWFIHINLVNSPEYCAAWSWFFNYFHHEIFTKDAVLTKLIKHLKLSSSKKISTDTLNRDISCLLRTYAEDTTLRNIDPEDEMTSPLTELELLIHGSNSKKYKLNRKAKPIPYEIFLYAIQISIPFDFSTKEGKREIAFHELTKIKNSPNILFIITHEQLFELIIEYDQTVEDFKHYGLAGDRILEYTELSQSQIFTRYYKEPYCRKKAVVT